MKNKVISISIIVFFVIGTIFLSENYIHDKNIEKSTINLVNEDPGTFPPKTIKMDAGLL